MRTIIGDCIHNLLKQHRGEAEAITAPEIGLQLGIPERDVRQIIANEFREWISPPDAAPSAERKLLIGLPGTGFFFATEAEQIERKQRVLIANKLQADCKLADFHDGMRRAGFGGLVTDRIPETFTNASQPNQDDRKRRVA